MLNELIDLIEKDLATATINQLFEFGIALKVMEDRLWYIDVSLAQRCLELQKKILNLDISQKPKIIDKVSKEKEISKEKLIRCYCPSDFGYIDLVDTNFECLKDCKECWNREIELRW